MLFIHRLHSSMRQLVCFRVKTVFVFLFFGLLAIGCGSADDVLKPDMNIQLTASPEQVNLLGYSSLTATARKVEGGKPLIEYAAKFSFVQNQSGAVLTPLSSVTDASGQAFCQYQAGSKPGVDIIQVTIDNQQSVSTRIVVAGGVIDTIILSITANPQTLSNFQRSTITVRATRQSNGEPMAGLDVTFSTRQNNSNGVFVQTVERTDASGIAVAVYQTGEQDGVDIIMVTLDNGQTAGVTLVVN